MMLAFILLTLFSVAILFLGFIKQRNVIIPISILAILSAIISISTEQNFWNHYLMDMIRIDFNSKIVSLIILYTGLALVPFFALFQKRGNEELADFMGIFIFSIVGALLMVGAVNYMTLFLGVEILSISMYILAGADRRKVKSNEASLKYFIMGAFASAFMLFGIGLIYASTGSLSLLNIASQSSVLTDFALVFLFSSFAFKIALVPFHFWTPDVYEGTPTLFTAAMSTIVKVAAFGSFYNLIQLNTPLLPDWIQWYFVFLILATLIIGNLMALSQRSVKRLLAYSGIVQAGFILMGFLQLDANSEWPIFFYFIAYTLASLVAFIVVHFVEVQSGSDDIDSFAGLSKSNPSLAIFMTLALISLAGGPLTAGFIAKLLMLNQAIQSGFSALVIIAVICTLMSVYYYYKIVNSMFSKSGDSRWSIPFIYNGLLLIFIIITFAAGIVPTYFTNLLRNF
ncbi:MAG: NADH-quinone oxidoreductase subunit N [Saprospiraceae bacterium]|nr:NADH-quinone oxidoreductase subunit N [Saprospiraceae bacterium]MBK8450821.1 NADH-quinone oxidoreductase subunit N [Saprospiraceae bacterium]MBK8485097.1 NADH-quinone oxidoreductase subunit N [Saprospiraceae bacterium]MBK9223102.1 NADH-quinone oxidoreductase subunit N [Saprospiraceae bacterium]MBK9720632.1 NADH-quinone oxidoreductase subunit N [Saprospiraceae bacterium]